VVALSTAELGGIDSKFLMRSRIALRSAPSQAAPERRENIFCQRLMQGPSGSPARVDVVLSSSKLHRRSHPINRISSKIFRIKPSVSVRATARVDGNQGKTIGLRFIGRSAKSGSTQLGRYEWGFSIGGNARKKEYQNLGRKFPIAARVDAANSKAWSFKPAVVLRSDSIQRRQSDTIGP
jgi:hypothetical protein